MTGIIKRKETVTYTLEIEVTFPIDNNPMVSQATISEDDVIDSLSAILYHCKEGHSINGKLLRVGSVVNQPDK